MYDLLVPEGEDPARFQPKPLDGEVEKFEVCAVVGSCVCLSYSIPIHRIS